MWFDTIYMKLKRKQNSSMLTEVRTVITLGSGCRMGKSTRELSRMMEIFFIFNWVVNTLVYQLHNVLCVYNLGRYVSARTLDHHFTQHQEF